LGGLRLEIGLAELLPLFPLPLPRPHLHYRSCPRIEESCRQCSEVSAYRRKWEQIFKDFFCKIRKTVRQAGIIRISWISAVIMVGRASRVCNKMCCMWIPQQVRVHIMHHVEHLLDIPTKREEWDKRNSPGGLIESTGFYTCFQNKAAV
jgi:hypothetical protein